MSFPGMGFANIPSVPLCTETTPAQLLQANILTVTRVLNPDVNNAPAAVPFEGMGWMSGHGATGTGASSLKYVVKNEEGVDIVLVDSNVGGGMSAVSLLLRSPDSGEFLRLVSQSAPTQVVNLILPTGKPLGDIFVETKAKKDKEKDKIGKDGKPKKEKDEKKSKEGKEKKEKDKYKDSPKRKYLLKNAALQEVMSVSIKSKAKDHKLEMKIKSLQRKGEVCLVESVGGPGTLQIRFSINSASIPNEKLYGLGAALGIIELELGQVQAPGPSASHRFPVTSH